MKMFRHCLYFGILPILVTACTKGEPDFQAITEDAIPRPKFVKDSNNPADYTKRFVTGSADAQFAVNGFCHPKISDIQAVAVGSTGSTSLRDIALPAVDVSCAPNGTFKFTLKKITDMGYAAPVLDRTYVIELRGVTPLGVSKPSFIEIKYSTSTGGTAPIVVSSGGAVESTGTNGYSAKNIRVGFKGNHFTSPQTEASQAHTKTDGTSTGFSAKFGVRLKTN